MRGCSTVFNKKKDSDMSNYKERRLKISHEKKDIIVLVSTLSEKNMAAHVSFYE